MKNIIISLSWVIKIPSHKIQWYHLRFYCQGNWVEGMADPDALKISASEAVDAATDALNRISESLWSNPELGELTPLQWRHNGHDNVSNHQPHDCLLNRLFRRRSKKTSKLRVTGLCAGNSPGTGEFPAQMASNAENISIWWRHHAVVAIATIRGFTTLYKSCNKVQDFSSLSMNWNLEPYCNSCVGLWTILVCVRITITV